MINLWLLVKDEVYNINIVNEFQINGNFDEVVIHIFHCFVSKIKNHVQLEEYSLYRFFLIGDHYKILSDSDVMKLVIISNNHTIFEVEIYSRWLGDVCRKISLVLSSS